MSAATHEVHLHDPHTLYRHWEESQWSPWDVDLPRDREQWNLMDDRSLIMFVLEPRKEPWGQTVARLQSPQGAIVGISYAPVLHDED